MAYYYSRLSQLIIIACPPSHTIGCQILSEKNAVGAAQCPTIQTWSPNTAWRVYKWTLSAARCIFDLPIWLVLSFNAKSFRENPIDATGVSIRDGSVCSHESMHSVLSLFLIISSLQSDLFPATVADTSWEQCQHWKTHKLLLFHVSQWWTLPLSLNTETVSSSGSSSET